MTELGSRPQPVPPGWRRSGRSLHRELAFRDFDQAIAFVTQVANAAEDHLRRPDMCIVAVNHVRLTITNPHRAGLTLAEMRLAEKVNVVIDRDAPALHV